MKKRIIFEADKDTELELDWITYELKKLGITKTLTNSEAMRAIIHRTYERMKKTVPIPATPPETPDVKSDKLASETSQ